MVRFRSVISLLASVSWGTAQLVSTGFSVSYNDVDYYVSPYASGTIPVSASRLKSLSSVHGFLPVAIVSESVAESDLTALVSNWTATDDVFQPAFLQAVFLAGAGASYSQRTTIAGNVTSQVMGLNATSTIPSGPYFMEKSTGDLYPVYRLYNDFAGAFTESLLAKPDGAFQSLSAQISTSATLTIGVPSRLYYTPTAEKPLAGVRIAVKDIFSLAGVKKSNGNRAWFNLYPASNVTGPAISRLIKAGAVIVGTQKLSQFANGEEATADWVDYHSPFNPRGDGYQDPSSSSSGAGASIASYEWLDVAVGSDTGGSIRSPSQAQGIFGNRPSHGLVSLDDVMPLCTHLDTAGFLLRDPTLWDKLEAVMYAGNYTSLADKSPKYPTKILTVSFPNSSTEAGAILNSFAASLASFVGGSVEPLDLISKWSSTLPSGVPPNTGLLDLLAYTYPTLIGLEQVKLVKTPFFADYAAAHDGRTPFVDPAPLTRWAWASSFPSSALDDAIANKTFFMDWFNTAILSPVPDQCSSALLLYSGSMGDQNPRNQYFDPPSVPLGFSEGRLSVFSECPDSVFPLGQVAAFSEVTNHEEFFPVSVDIMAAKGCDGLLARLAVDLVERGLLKVPKVGSTMLGGDILMRSCSVNHSYSVDHDKNTLIPLNPNHLTEGILVGPPDAAAAQAPHYPQPEPATAPRRHIAAAAPWHTAAKGQSIWAVKAPSAFSGVGANMTCPPTPVMPLGTP
ncbi:glutamyl-tRNA amidotransferase [Pseudomassariella vexata]|uniref:Glutamyl-tRNA amidotransferase n=1 Tax=Pseudomassariella vexata TaxID=1141098 RepID=A0A1Y2DFI2_9PEZI|nr:glutamyl-tRNA amidotransferase [Pseudomassariella vexata]ORY58053.1 glutamyl-tRNA amidotransferase [Pseudomassariella vexata]